VFAFVLIQESVSLNLFEINISMTVNFTEQKDIIKNETRQKIVLQGRQKMLKC
jgi:hypothetical protein